LAPFLLDSLERTAGQSVTYPKSIAMAELNTQANMDATLVNENSSGRFICGAILIGGSFLVYLAYPIILLMTPASGTIKIAATILLWALSWAVFSAGIFLTGPEGYRRFKNLWSRNKSRTLVKTSSGR